jgi:arylsulfatase A-like enzyme
MGSLTRAAAVPFLLALAGTAWAAPPNILFILSDDQGWPTLSSYGGRLVPTPHLDGLAREGMRFTQAYVTPQCTPTRAALLTGQHTARNGMWHVIPWYGYPWARVAEPGYVEQLPREAFTLAKGLRQAGYATAIVGKWHLTANADGHYEGLLPAAAPHYGFEVSVPSLPREGGYGDKGVARFTDEAIRFVEEHRDRPWFLYLSHHTIHNPVLAPPALVQEHLARGAPAAGLHNATYLASIEHLDASIGRLLARLDALGLASRTLVVFLSDNGGVHRLWDAERPARDAGGRWRLALKERQLDNAPLREGKGSAYEGGIRVPCLVRWPGAVKPGTVSDTPVHVVDWLPTLLEVAGARPPEGHVLDGTSLVAHLRGGPGPRRPLYWYLPLYDTLWGATPSAVVRDGDLKLIEFFGDWIDGQGLHHEGHRLELYDLAKDPGETRDLAATQEREAERLHGQLRAWMASVGAPVPGLNPRHDPLRALVKSRTKGGE